MSDERSNVHDGESARRWPPDESTQDGVKDRVPSKVGETPGKVMAWILLLCLGSVALTLTFALIRWILGL